METIYLIIVVILFILAFSDLIVGVSNDAVNFLNSAVGAKVASFRTIMIIAAIGIFVGAIMSNGMMEITRKGIFHPQFFTFAEVMVIFVTVMITDVVLLDMFNSFGMPTSTTVSLVFELLGASVAVAIIKVVSSADPALSIGQYINSEKALVIIGGILFSVVVAFTIGSLVQFIARTLFTFNYKKKMKYFSGIFGGTAITAIIYFMLIKGLKDASFMTDTAQLWIEEHTMMILGVGFIFFTLFLQALYSFFKINVLKIVVLTGTFALALAFAGNDLVNFLGVPLAGLDSYRTFISTPGADPDSLLMVSLTQSVKSDWYLLALAGIIMGVTLFTSKKAQSVMKTSLDLSRQSAGTERFESSALARSVVRASWSMASGLSKYVPDSWKKAVDKRFDKTVLDIEEGASFDMIRASVNLVVAGTLIAIGTAYKLPLSTTYVTFMVAMGSSLADRAWGRESAVYRITGVISVIGGWFLTAVIAFIAAFILACVIYFGKIYAMVALTILAFFLIFRTQRMFNKKSGNDTKATDEVVEETNPELTKLDQLRNVTTSTIARIISSVSENYDEITSAFIVENRRKLKDMLDSINKLKEEAEQLKKDFTIKIRSLDDKDAVNLGVYYFQCVDFTTETIYDLENITRISYEHVDNNFKPLTPEQKEEFTTLKDKMSKHIKSVADAIEQNDFEKFSSLLEKKEAYALEISTLERRQLKRIKIEHTSTKVGLTYLTILSETNNIAQEIGNLLKTYLKFMGKKQNVG